MFDWCRIEATAPWVSGSETVGATGGCGATTACGSGGQGATLEVCPTGILPGKEETTGIIASLGNSREEVPTSVSEVWAGKGGRSSTRGVDERVGEGELGRWMDGIPDTSGSSTGKRDCRS